MALKALEKLRTAARNMAKGRNLENHEECNLFLIIADEIEAEIAERYMLLPVDADDEPIRVGDVLDPPKGSEEYGRLMVTELGYDGEDWYFKGEIPASFTGQAGYFNVIGFTHAKPRTLEDVLRDVWKEALDYAKSDIWRNPDEVFVERADEIRELLRGDA